MEDGVITDDKDVAPLNEGHTWGVEVHHDWSLRGQPWCAKDGVDGVCQIHSVDIEEVPTVVEVLPL